MTDDVGFIKLKANEILYGGYRTGKSMAPHGRCDKCGYPLIYEPTDPACHDQPEWRGGFFCDSCGEYK